jgi:hypothetical protein
MDHCVAVHADAAFRIKLYERPLSPISLGFISKNNNEHAIHASFRWTEAWSASPDE